MTSGFQIRTSGNRIIRFHYYSQHAPITCEAFAKALPFSYLLLHARYSGSEIWTPLGPKLDIIQENASIFTAPGEVVLGPVKPTRNKAGGGIGIYYGEGRGLDACNIFAKVFDDDLPLLAALGEQIWKNGEQEIVFEAIG